MDDILETINTSLLIITSKLKEEFEYEIECVKGNKKIKLSELESAVSNSAGSSSEISQPRPVIKPLINSEVFEVMASEEMSPWEESLFNDIAEGFLLGKFNKEILFKNHALLHALWQRLHTGHWSDVPVSLKSSFTLGSVILVGHMLRELQDDICTHGENTEELIDKTWKVVLACDRGLLMGKPINNSPLPKVASLLNKYAVKNEDFKEIQPPKEIDNFTPVETHPFPDIKVIETIALPPLQDFLLNYMEKIQPVKICGIAQEWPALTKWNFKYFSSIAGSRTVPVEIGLRYSDSDWSQKLMTINQYMGICTSEGEDKEKAYLAQHQLLDQIPELLCDIIVPDYCHMGERDPVYGHKLLLIFPESDTQFLYPFDDTILNNTSQINLEEVASRPELLKTRPLLKNAKGYYLILSPGDALYIPPKWWHYVRSLSNSISVSFWWR
ncbi:Lysine-specific demethylase 8 [Armadillidium vulgare]|nr:Lysine-specific demethylase 8 [Armadillidium vulgare]